MDTSLLSPTLLTGKVAIVSGSTQGIGTDIARVLAACGASVVLLGRGADAGQALCAELLAAGAAGALYCPTDVERDDDIERCIALTLARFGRLDILVNNACIYQDCGLDSSCAEWHQTLGVNLISAAIFAQKAVPHMGPGAVIFNLGSTGGKFGAAGSALYPASKTALLQLTRNLAVTLAPQRIRVVAVSPAWTWSPSIAELSGNWRAVAEQVAASLHPLGRVGDGAEVGQAVAFLASAAASWITGVDIPVDGGFSILGPDRGVLPRSRFARTEAACMPSMPRP